jgi:hypothetical protein
VLSSTPSDAQILATACLRLAAALVVAKLLPFPLAVPAFALAVGHAIYAINAQLARRLG